MNNQPHEVTSALFVFRHQKSLCEKAMAQLEEKDLFRAPSNEMNSIAVIARHLSGNMKSRWTNFLTEDGEKPWRERDSEFSAHDLKTRKELMVCWDEGWKTLFESLESLSEDDMSRKVTIRGVEHSITEAIHRQLSHYGYHTGQIVLIARMFKGCGWETLSIAKGKSNNYQAKGKY